MNLPLLWRVHEEAGDKRYYDIAFQHYLNATKEFVMDNYSTIHVVDFDLESGKLVEKGTGQGYSSTFWSRGQDGAIYGFALSYNVSQVEIFVEAAQGLADYLVRNLPDDYVPYWDLNDPQSPRSVRDSSAAAIACSGLFTLTEFRQKRKRKVMATRILSSLSTNYLTGDDCEGILKHGCFRKPENIGVDASLIWGDYYFLEVLGRT